ncbi:MAG: DUF3341 domain-containing protein [Deltaproteobacteria bacterium]|nr:DUF3341 domain-containing protein [Deltaproteobacteria bacterium]
MDTTNAILGLYSHVENLLDASKKAKRSGYSTEIFSPIPLVHEIEHVEGEKTDYVRFFTLLGGICGLSFGILFPITVAVIYIIPRGGNPIVSIPPTLLIGYEATILIGVIMTIIGFVLVSKMPSFRGRKVDEPQVSVDAFGLLIKDVEPAEYDDVERFLMETGASEVKRVEEN